MAEISTEELDARLNRNNWNWCLISQPEPGKFRLQMSDNGEEETGWRKCFIGNSVEEVAQEAEKLVQTTNAYEYGKGRGFAAMVDHDEET